MFKKRKTILYVILILLLVGAFLLFVFPQKSEVTATNTGTDNLYPSEKMNFKNSYSQELKCDYDNTRKLSTKFSTYLVENKSGSILFSVINKNTNYNETRTINLTDLKDNGIYYYESKEVICNKDENIAVTMKFNEYSKNNSLAYWYSSSDDNSLKINDNSTDRKLSITTYGSKNEYTNLWFPIMFIFLDIMALIMEDNKDDEK